MQFSMAAERMSTIDGVKGSLRGDEAAMFVERITKDGVATRSHLWRSGVGATAG